MKKISYILILAALVVTLDTSAQKGDKKEKELKSKQLKERSRSLGGQQTESDIPADKSTTNADKKNTVSSDTAVAAENSDNSGQVIDRNKDQSGRPARGSAPAVIQRTTSESGSPAVLSEENGNGRDGTNNVQRAKPNIAGAEEPGNMNLDKKNYAEKNINTGEQKIQKQEERPQTDLSKREQTQNKQQVKEQREQDIRSGEDKLRSDENLSKKEKRKERRKNRRSRDKDSGK